ncbi:MAG: hypothetical protein Q4D19_10635 [Lautropia sp.]|nr:hypothetical protein [Lautropia sp.]
MRNQAKPEKALPLGGLYIPPGVLVGIFAYHTILLSISRLIGDGLGRLSIASLFLSFGAILGGLILGRLSVLGRIVLPLWVIGFVVLLQVVIAVAGRHVFCQSMF